MLKIYKKSKSKLYKKSLQKYKSKLKTLKKRTHIQTGGKTVNNLVIKYDDTVLFDGANGMLLERQKTVNEPQINVNLSGKTLLIMYDKNAPNGEENTLKNNKNYMHMVKIYTNGKINENDMINDVKLTYNPPSPPKGTHNYIFKLYSFVNSKGNSVNSVNSNLIPKGNAGFTYFETVNNIIQNLLMLKKLQLISTISFKVKVET